MRAYDICILKTYRLLQGLNPQPYAYESGTIPDIMNKIKDNLFSNLGMIFLNMFRSKQSALQAMTKRVLYSPSISNQCVVGSRSSIATAGSDVVQSGRPIFDDFFQHLWPYIGNNTANVVFQMVKRLWLIRIDQ
ncbi:hypothetical protein TNCV_3151271 [Trichonephila clavipes]|nr:hypothetical protein TNCV_3151271 [Trichonephila clavipes]